MRSLFLYALILCAACASAAHVRLNVNAPSYAGERILLYRYADPFTLRTELIASTRLDAQGNARIEADVTGTTKASLHIGSTSADLWLRGADLSVEMPAADAKQARSVNGTTRVDLVFKNLDPLDVNALTADLNERLDGFIAEDLATDQAAGMQAMDIARKENGALHPDSARRPGTLFVTPSWSSTRVDTFDMKLRKFYADVKDPWFWQDLEYGIGGLRFGPRANDRELFERALKGKPVLYTVPEYVRFVNSFFEDHLMRYPFRSDEAALMRAISEAQLDSVKTVFAKNDFLKDDDRLCELVVLQQLYANYHGKVLDRSGIRRILEHARDASTYTEHRAIAANMLWDLITMRPGDTWPSLVLRDTEGTPVRMDTLLHGATVVAVTATWCTYCEQEITALEALYKEYGEHVRFVALSLDANMNDLKTYLRAHPQRDWLWLFGGDDPTITDLLRVRSIPAFFLLNDATLAQSPAPPPSNGMAALLFKVKAQWVQENTLKPDDGRHAPRR